MPSADPAADAGTAVPATADVNAGAGSDARCEAGSDADSSTGADADPAADSGASDPGEDTMDLRLPDELLALIADEVSDGHGARRPGQGTAQPSVSTAASRAASGLSVLSALPTDDLLDRVADWGPTDTPAGVFHLVPVRVERDLPLISRWMNDPAAAAFWELSGPQRVTEDHVLSQLAGDGRSVPCIGVLDGRPMSYWEIYRADLDPLARHYPARPHDTGLHLLVGAVADRGRGLGGLLLRAVADLVLAQRPSCARVIAEPDIRNTPSIAAFLTAGFRFSAEVDLPDKRAALMVRDRSLRHVL
ncbi:putative Rhizobactin siderophore biosynthesis protein RhbD [Streptomyces afghaniensis 772]|uniref:Lysine N-acyltransferase MbtK n=1 Tax=Streptomyces afghaniensis 772 TaxID=1283301 RepID=S4MCK2_9ACTN|nr:MULTISPECIES: GNAT family N-acetyltransferase [Streptomyces]EPJ37243.1 putative Rhizobactin siderophore biosynthesis protein RhbD [Streptomyces afghaniensis 772]UOB09816.1 GNAT family N-acetyltransferase [Streptomyces sp. HP-A2021]